MEGFVYAYELFFVKNEGKNFDKHRAIQKYCSTLQYGDALYINQTKIHRTMYNIVNKLEDEKDTEFIAFQIIKAICNNEKLNDIMEKERILNETLNFICDFYEADKRNKTKRKIILDIFSQQVLFEENNKKRNIVYNALIKNLYINNPFSNDREYVKTIAFILRGAFFVIEKEKETLKESYRIDLKEMLKHSILTKDKVNISFSELFTKEPKDYFDFYIEDSFDEERISIFDYFPEGKMNGKMTVWTLLSKINFAFCFYYAFNMYGRFFDKILELYDKGFAFFEDRIYNAICNNYEKYDGKINDNIMEDINLIREYLGYERLVNNIIDIKTYEKINEFLSTKMLEKGEENKKYDGLKLIEEIQEYIISEMGKYSILELDNNIILETKHEMQLQPRYIVKGSATVKMQQQDLKAFLLNVINQKVRDSTEEFQLQYMQTDGEKLLKKMGINEYKFRNFNIESMGEGIRNSEEYISIINKIPYYHERGIRENVFLTKDKISYNFNIMRLKLLPLNEDEIEEYLEKRKIVTGKYKLFDVIFDKNKAEKWVKKEIKKEDIIISINCEIGENGIRIKY